MAEKPDQPLVLGPDSETVEIIPMRSLHRKLAQILHEAERIPKNGTAPQAMGGYRFVQVGDAADFIRKALAEQTLTMMPTNVAVVGQVDRPTKSGGTMTTVDLLVDWTITDGESGESIVIQSFGAGADGGDKYSGKAMTSAMKYAFLAGFLLSTGDDTEQHTVENVQRTPAEVNAQERERLAMADADRQGQVTTTPPAPDVETEELVGDAKRSGMVRLGSGVTALEARQGPDGYIIGFRLETANDGNIPQVIVAGPAGEALMMATGRNPGAMRDTRATVSGRLFNVKRPGKRSYFRLKVTSWEWGDYAFPADEPELPQPPDDVPLVGEAPPLGLVK